MSPDDVLLELQSFSENHIPVIVFDEFDRRRDADAKTLMADTIKALSDAGDTSVNVTVVIVGVAEDISFLIKEHESIARCLVQIRMPRMKQEELATIITSRLRANGMRITDDAIWLATYLSRGLPYYTHLIGLEHRALNREHNQRP